MAIPQYKLEESSCASSCNLESEVLKDNILEKMPRRRFSSQSAYVKQGSRDLLLNDNNTIMEEHDSIKELERNFRLVQCEYEIAKVERDLKAAQRRQSTKLTKATRNRSIKINGVSERNGSYTHMLKELSSLISED